MSRSRPAGSGFIGGGAPFTVSVVVNDGYGVVTAVGEIDRETSSKLSAAIARAAVTAHSIELDLGAVRFMDSQGLRAIVEAQSSVGTDRSFRIIEASPQVHRLLEVTGLAEVFSPDLVSDGGDE